MTAPLPPEDQRCWALLCEAADAVKPSRQTLHPHEYRPLLWDKVGPAMRRAGDPQEGAFEETLCRKYVPPRAAPPRQDPLWKKPIAALYRSLRALIDDNRFLGKRGAAESPLFVPLPNARLAAVFQQHDFPAPIVTRASDLPEFRNALFLPEHWSQPRQISDRPEEVDIIREALQQNEVMLSPGDADQLAWEICRLRAESLRTHELLEDLVQPSAVFVYADNHPPQQSHVLWAKVLDIPSLMLQHGLDCEHYFLDEAYADHVAVWGEARAERYRRDSAHQPNLVVTGNPAWDDRRLPERLDPRGDCWLWVTRPHAPEKCQLPSRKPSEGLAIFRALATAVRRGEQRRLVIKPHPYDYGDLYEAEAEKLGVRDRVSVVKTPLDQLFPSARLVVSEDSTAGLEAMFWGKPVVHAHFCESPPVLPFVEEGSALPGFDAEQLADSLGRAEELPPEARAAMLEAQRATLLRHAGPCDGRAGERVRALIAELLAR